MSAADGRISVEVDRSSWPSIAPERAGYTVKITV
jgi:hypothetical protein